MKVVTFAAGLAAGYVLGTRAGREKYQQIVATAKKVSSHPSVQQAQDKAKDLIGAGTDAVTTKIASATSSSDTTDGGEATFGSDAATPRPPRRKTVTVTTEPTIAPSV
jgi:hypothetical protein